MNKKNVLLAGLLGTLSLGAESATFMDATWASQLCQAWNKNPNLTGKLGGDGWVANNAGRGYKTIQLYRDECGLGSKVELQISDKDGKAICTRGGAVENKDPDYKVDYLMHASNKNWACMGEGSFGCGAMGAMTTGKLKFSGPKGEAMGVMGPFDEFLVLTGQIGGDKDACP
jgi:putative sterol carrier protein